MTAGRNFLKGRAWVVWIGMLTGGAIVLSRVISLFVIYRYLKLDYYLCVVAVCFATAGWMLHKRASIAGRALAITADGSFPSSPVPAVSREDILAVLTSKEVLVLRLLAESKTNKEIAAELFIELSTVKTHINNIYTKLSVSNRKEARSKYAEMAQKFPSF